MSFRSLMLTSLSAVALTFAPHWAGAAYLEQEDPDSTGDNDFFEGAELVPEGESMVEGYLAISEGGFDGYGYGSGDVDFYAFTDLTPGSVAAFEVFNTDRDAGGLFPNLETNQGIGANSEFDSVLGIFVQDEGGFIEQIASDDDSGFDLFSRVAAIVPQDGVLLVAVSGWPDFDFNNSHGESGDYGLARISLPQNIQVEVENVLLDPELVGGGFLFNDVDVEDRGIWFVFDPIVAIGYEMTITSGGGFFEQVVAPVVPGDDGFYELVYDGGSLSLTADVPVDISALELTSFSIQGIDVAAMLDPNNPAAFGLGVTFSEGGSYDVDMTPITFDTESTGVPAPAAAGLLGLGAAMAGRHRWKT